MSAVPPVREVAPGVACLTLSRLVNVVFLDDGAGRWWLVDTGMGRHFDPIRRVAAARFGPASAPEAILLTHARPDHVGSALALAAYWNVPVRVARAELPFVDGRVAYPPADTGVGGPLALLTALWRPRTPDLGRWVRPWEQAPPGWEMVPLPGPTPGHTGLWRAADRVLLAGDALSHIDFESWRAFLRGRPRLALPPPPLVMDWEALRRSWNTIADLAPRALVCGHGPVRDDDGLAARLRRFADVKVMARKGRYVSEPVRFGEDGQLRVPASVPDPAEKAVKVVGAALLVGGLWWLWRRRRGA